MAGKRSGLFFEIARLVGEIRPAFIFLENVPAIRTRGAEVVCGTLARLGYDCRWDVVSAAEVGAPHLRKRWFLLAHSNGAKRGLQPESRRGEAAIVGNDGPKEFVAYSEIERTHGPERAGEPHVERGGEAMADAPGVGRLERRPESIVSREARRSAGGSNPSWWEVEPNVGRVVNELPSRVDRLRALGNAVVPLQAQTAFKRLMGLK